MNSSTRTDVSITATIDRAVSQADVRSALVAMARDNGVALSSLEVTVTPGESVTTVDIPEGELAAFLAWRDSRQAGTATP
jgi:hypothetical protein